MLHMRWCEVVPPPDLVVKIGTKYKQKSTSQKHVGILSWGIYIKFGLHIPSVCHICHRS